MERRMARRLIAGVETGGTKILAQLCDFDSQETLAAQKWSTSSAEQAAEDLAAFHLQAVPEGHRLAAIGMAAFGPLIIDPSSPDYGQMQATSKPGWAGSNLRAALE